MDDKRRMLRHFLAALGLPDSESAPGCTRGLRGVGLRIAGVRSPTELSPRHDESVLGYARTIFIGGHSWPRTAREPAGRSRPIAVRCSKISPASIESDAPMLNGLSPEQLLQGPLSDAMTHVGQLALLRRLQGS